MRKSLHNIVGLVILSALAVTAKAQISEQAAREQASNAVRSQLQLNLGQFLQVHRDENLEESLAEIISKPLPHFVYRISQAGDEIKENGIVHHIYMDVDPTYTVVINPGDGSIYRIRGFKDSLGEFERLMASLKVTISTADQAEAVADFYRASDPERYSPAAISSLIDLKQAAERQCQASSFDVGESAFDSWWKHAKPLYARALFRQTAVSHGNGYLVEWIVLSSPADSNCGGAPLRARLEVDNHGHVGKLTLLPVAKE